MEMVGFEKFLTISWKLLDDYDNGEHCGYIYRYIWRWPDCQSQTEKTGSQTQGVGPRLEECAIVRHGKSTHCRVWVVQYVAIHHTKTFNDRDHQDLYWLSKYQTALHCSKLEKLSEHIKTNSCFQPKLVQSKVIESMMGKCKSCNNWWKNTKKN